MNLTVSVKDYEETEDTLILDVWGVEGGCLRYIVVLNFNERRASIEIVSGSEDMIFASNVLNVVIREFFERSVGDRPDSIEEFEIEV